MVEERGQESLFFAEHTHIPVSSMDSWSGEGRLPAKYWHCLDLFVALTAAAATTRKLRVGSGICLVIVGAGWNRQEMRNHGTDPRTRLTLMRERIEAMQAIWTQREASYAGQHVAFERILSYPKPLQRPAARRARGAARRFGGPSSRARCGRRQVRRCVRARPPPPLRIRLKLGSISLRENRR
jgi:alkanesulfonate monooxygenase SsuD/methylene tetrahydromethanopterin reductase-like flavin-dependent oxidoreductase (luciferase family)